MKDTIPLVYDWTGKHFDTCNFCGKVDILLPTSTVHLCPSCVKKGEWGLGVSYSKTGARSRVRLIKGYGRCDVCGVLAVGWLFSVEGWACFKCLWTKLAHRTDALRPDGNRIV